MSLAYHDGKFVEKDGITIGLGDFGFSRGVAVFELARIYGGIPFHLGDHLARLANGAATLGITCPLDNAGIKTVIRKLCDTNKYAHSAIKIYLTAGECEKPNGTSFAACEGFTPHLVIVEEEVRLAHPEAPYGVEVYQRGQKLKIVPFDRELPAIKSTNYAAGYYAARKIAGPAWDDILFTGRNGGITEVTRANFFCVVDGVLCTAKEGMLLGVTRKVLLGLANKIGIPTAERLITPADCARATEAFTTGSIAEMLPARQIDDHTLPTTVEGPIFTTLRAALTAYIKETIARPA